MRRFRQISLTEVAGWENLELALAKALRGKRCRADARKFVLGLPGTLVELGERIRSGAPCLGVFRDFRIRDPKPRLISAPCFADRVAHHAVMNLCEARFESWQIEDSYACRKGKGLHAAIERAARWSDRYPFFLKGDVRHYFENADAKSA